MAAGQKAARGAAHARRLPRRCTVLDRARGLRRDSLHPCAEPGAGLAGRRVRVDLRLDDYRRDGARERGRFAAIDSLLPPTATVVRGPRDRSARGRGLADARRRRHAAISRGAPGTDQRYEAHSADHGDGEGALVRVFRHDGGVRRLLLAGRHVRVRCDLPQLQHRVDRRLFHARREPGVLRQRPRRSGGDRLHVRGRRELLSALRRLARAQHAQLLRRPGISGLLLDTVRSRHDRHRVISRCPGTTM